MDFSKRLTKIKKLINAKDEAVLVSSVPNIIYLTGYSGFSFNEREAYLIITKSQNYIITDGRYTEAVYVNVPHFTLIERTLKNHLQQILADLIKKHKLKKLLIEESSVTVSEYKLFKKVFPQLANCSLDETRALKEKSEISKISKACQIGDSAFHYILKEIKSGITEKELAHKLEVYIKESNGELSFPTIVAFGANSSLPHHQTGNTRLEKKKEGQFVLLDFGVKYMDYCSDMTRTVLYGKATEKQKKVYLSVLRAQKVAFEYMSQKIKLKTSIKASQVDKIAREYILNAGYPSIPHSLGHCIGLEVHEDPRLAPSSPDILKSGMVFSVEPGIYIPKWGGVRIEDLVALSPSNANLLTRSPRGLIEL